jgi:hypothetical protein
MSQTELTPQQIHDGMMKMFGFIPNIEQEPIRFNYHLKLFLYIHAMSLKAKNDI